VPTPFQRFDDGALMGDVLLSAFHAAFGYLKPPLQFSAVHSASLTAKSLPGPLSSRPRKEKAPRDGGAEV
jgi:hypothetical protein